MAFKSAWIWVIAIHCTTNSLLFIVSSHVSSRWCILFAKCGFSTLLWFINIFIFSFISAIAMHFFFLSAFFWLNTMCMYISKKCFPSQNINHFTFLSFSFQHILYVSVSLISFDFKMSQLSIFDWNSFENELPWNYKANYQRI